MFNGGTHSTIALYYRALITVINFQKIFALTVLFMIFFRRLGGITNTKGSCEQNIT